VSESLPYNRIPICDQARQLVGFSKSPALSPEFLAGPDHRSRPSPQFLRSGRCAQNFFRMPARQHHICAVTNQQQAETPAGPPPSPKKLYLREIPSTSRSDRSTPKLRAQKKTFSPFSGNGGNSTMRLMKNSRILEGPCLYNRRTTRLMNGTVLTRAGTFLPPDTMRPPRTRTSTQK